MRPALPPSQPPPPTHTHRCYVPRVLDKDANMHFLHLDGMHALRPVPPFGIREPLLEYADGTPREDALETDAPLDLVRCYGGGHTCCRGLQRDPLHHSSGVHCLGQWVGLRRTQGPSRVATGRACCAQYSGSGEPAVVLHAGQQGSCGGWRACMRGRYLASSSPALGHLPLVQIVMPGLGFSRDGHRLGRGGGYYDKFIEACHQVGGWAAGVLGQGGWGG